MLRQTIEFSFLSILVIKYLAELYCVCVVWNTLDTDQITDINFDSMHVEEQYPKMIWLKYDADEGNQTNIDGLVRLGIDIGCQV